MPRTVWLDTIDETNYEVPPGCVNCSAKYLKYRSLNTQLPNPICGIGEVEVDLERTPTFGELRESGVKIDSISSDCFNNYQNLDSTPVKL